MQDHKNFVADQAFPIISSPSKSDDFYTYDRGMFNRDEMKELAPGARADAANYDITTDNFNAKVYALAKDIADQVRANADEPIKLDSEAAEFLALKVLIHKEVLWTASFFITGIWTEQRTGVASSPSGTDFLRWDVNSSQPIEDMRRAMRAVHSSTGFRPNKMVICRQGYDALLDHPDIIGRLAQGQTPGGPAMTQRENLTALFELEKILVLDSIVNSANEGATNSHDYIGDLNALLLYTPVTPGLMTPSAGYTFSWSGMFGGSALGARVKKIRMEPESSDRVQIEAAFVHKLIAADLGAMFLTVVSA